MPRIERLLWHRLGRTRLVAVRSLAALDAALLVVLAFGLLSAEASLVLLLAPTYSVLFLVLVATLAAFAESRLVSWQLVNGVIVGGPLVAALALHRLRRVS